MKRSFYRLSLYLLATAAGLGGTAARAAGPPPIPDFPVDAATRLQVIDGVLARLGESYVFPDKAKAMEKAVRERQKKKEYDAIASGPALCQKLTADLQAVSHDKHLRVLCSAQPRQIEDQRGEPSEAERERQRQFSRQTNHGFERVERLRGNIGYLDLRYFDDPELAGPTCAAAMNFLKDTDALIIDLRENHGGEPAMIALLTTYLFAGEPVHLNDIYWRPDNSTHQWWTLPFVPGERHAGKDVYVLTSKTTFSGAEEFSYNLKNLKRATLIGEVTGGGAHPVQLRSVTPHFAVAVPAGRAINPITKTNWEGTGVQPDITMPAADALRSAHVMALEKARGKTTDLAQRERLSRAIDELKGASAEARPQG